MLRAYKNVGKAGEKCKIHYDEIKTQNADIWDLMGWSYLR